MSSSRPFPPGNPFEDQRGSASPSRLNGLDGSSSSRWSFLNTPSPDLTLSVVGAPPDHAEASFSYTAEEPDDRASSDGEADEGEEQDEGAVHAAVKIHRVSSAALLVPSEDLHRSTSSAPDSFIDPHMPRPNDTSNASPSPSAHASALLPPSCLLPGPSRFDLAGRPLPQAPPPTDPFAQALSEGTAYPEKTAKHRLSLLARPFHRNHEDDTQSSIGSVKTSTSGYWDRSLSFNIPPSASTPQLGPFDSPVRPGPSPLHGTSRSQTNPEAVPRIPSVRAQARPLSEHVIVELPTIPAQTYSPKTPISPALAPPPRRYSQAISEPPPPTTSPPSPPRPTLASRRSAQQLPPLLPISTTPMTLSTPSPAHTPSSPNSHTSLSLPHITRSDDGFYRLPVTPSSASARRTRREREDTSDMAFPLPPVPDSAALLLDRVAADATWPMSYRGSSSGGPTPSPTYSLPTSPPPNSPPPPLPGFVSVFVDPHAKITSRFEDEDCDDDDDDLSRLPSQTTYPPLPTPPPRANPRHSHARAMESVSSSLASPRRQTLRQRVVAPPIEEHRASRTREASDEAKQTRMETWLRGLAPSRASSIAGDVAPSTGKSAESGKIRWAEKAAPGWSLRSDPARWGGDRAAGGGWKARLGSAVRSKKVRILAAVGFVAVLLVVVGLATGLTRKAAALAASTAAAACNCEHGGSARATSDGLCYCSCSAEWGGTSCHLNATCVDVGGGPVAQGLLDLTDEASTLWQPALNASQLRGVLKSYFLPSSASTSSTCQSQLSLLVLPNLPSSAYPSRLRWTESALVHTLVRTESNSTLTQLRTFASGLSFAPFGDSPASKPNSNYQVIAGGWTWDLAVLQRSATGSWASVVKPSSEVAARLAAAPAAQRALDRLAPAAAAASAQRTKALEHYWTDTLGRTSDELAAFRTAVQSAEVVIPFDATASVGGTEMMDLAAAQTDAGSFPPAIGCWAGLSDEVVERVNAVERDVFGLDAVLSSQAFNTSCVDRPLYGVLNLLQLRVPFPSTDSRSPLPQQSLVLFSDTTASRITVHAGELLAAGPLVDAPTSPSQPATLERFGLISRLDHVLFDLLAAVPVSTATDLVTYILSSPSGPPSATTYPSLLTGALPLLEVQLWGGLRYDDVDFARSSLVSPADKTSLFFGSTEGDAFGSWAVQNAQHASLGRVEWSKPTPPVSPAKAGKDTLSPAKKVSKPVKPVASAPKPRTKREEDSPRLAWTAATRVQSPLRSSEELSVAPPAALAVVGPPKSSPFVKRTPLFIQRHVHPEPALQPGKIPSFSSTRTVLYQPHPSAFASSRPNKRTRELEGASGRSPAKQGKSAAKRAKIAKPSSTLNLLKPPTTRERSSSLSSLSSLDASDSDLTSLDSSDEGEGAAKGGSTDEVYETLQGELEVLRRQNARRIDASIEALSSSFKSSKPSLTASPALATKPRPPRRKPKPHPPSQEMASLASTSEAAHRLSPKSKGKGKVEVISVITSDEDSGEESEDEVVLLVSPKRGEPNAPEEGAKSVSFAPLPTPALDVDDSDDESVEGDWEEVSEDEYYRSQAGSSTFRNQATQ
ncbi:hypothetical protein JCM10450v2_003248 [Rhodotorula kratochvilovae]